MVIEGNGHEDHMYTEQDTIFSDQCKSVDRLEGNHSDEDNRRLYTLICVTVANYGLSYYNKNETEKNEKVAWKYLEGYYYSSTN